MSRNLFSVANVLVRDILGQVLQHSCNICPPSCTATEIAGWHIFGIGTGEFFGICHCCAGGLVICFTLLQG